jgi:hypothetical protein
MGAVFQAVFGMFWERRGGDPQLQNSTWTGWEKVEKDFFRALRFPSARLLNAFRKRSSKPKSPDG